MLKWDFIRDVGPFRCAARYVVLQFRKRVLKRDTRLRLPTGLTINLPRQSKTSTEIYLTRANVDWGAEAIFATFADPRRDFLDIGSHIGYYAAYLAPLVRRAYAFEPDPRNLPGLTGNAAQSKNIEVVEMAVGAQDGVVEFFPGRGSSVGSLTSDGGPPIKVPITTIDSWLANRPETDVADIKIDIEGHDMDALRGMEATVAAFQPLILTECELSAELFSLCSRWNYQVFAQLKHLHTRGSHFAACRPEDREAWRTKMLFLVPPRLAPAFARLAAPPPTSR